MDYSEIDLGFIKTGLEDYFREKEDRKIVIRTGVGGMDLFNEATDKWLGFERVYIGNKIPRILRFMKISINQNLAGRYYRLIKTNGKVF